MLTPSFELRQDPLFLTIIIKARYAKVPETEVFVDGADFKFYSKPYFLRLSLPGRLLEDGREKASYDVESGTFTVRVPKETEGEHFADLDLLTRLLAPKGQMSAKEPCIEVLGNGEGMEVKTGAGETDEEEEFDWQVSQQPCCEDEEGLDGLKGAVTYGFANRRSGVFKRLRDEICGVVDIEEADSVSLPERKRARMMAEKDKFDDSHYLADLYQNEVFGPLLQYRPPWVHSYKKMREKMVKAGDKATHEEPTTDFSVDFSEAEKELMLKFPRKEYILSDVEEKGALLGAADILFAYAYNVRTNEGENSVESAWTVCKLSSTLSCLDWFHTPREMAIACCRRALCYPLYRNWDLCCKLIKDVRMILRLGRNQVLKCFFEIHKLLSGDEPRYILNDLYISDYCVWLQSIPSERFAALEQDIGELQLEKKDIGLDLQYLEEAASAVRDEVESQRMGAATQQDPNSLSHSNPQLQQPHSQQSLQDLPQEVVHLVGYPDLIQKTSPGPDVVTTRVARASDNDDGGEDDDSSEDEESDGEADDSDDEEDGGENKDIADIKNGEDDRSEEIANDDVRDGVNRTCATCPKSSLEQITPNGHSTLKNNFTSKVTTANSDQADDAFPHPACSSLCEDVAYIIRSGANVDVSEESRTLGESSNGLKIPDAESDVEVVETMKDMLDQLSLDPAVSSATAHPNRLAKTSCEDGGTGLFTEWAQTPPAKMVEMFDTS